jgi:hypothetical protein
MTKFFVYVSSTLGPSPQIWHEDLSDGAGKSQKPLLKFKLKEGEENLGWEELKVRYPYVETLGSR